MKLHTLQQQQHPCTHSLIVSTHIDVHLWRNYTEVVICIKSGTQLALNQSDCFQFRSKSRLAIFFPCAHGGLTGTGTLKMKNYSFCAALPDQSSCFVLIFLVFPVQFVLMSTMKSYRDF